MIDAGKYSKHQNNNKNKHNRWRRHPNNDLRLYGQFNIAVFPKHFTTLFLSFLGLRYPAVIG